MKFIKNLFGRTDVVISEKEKKEIIKEQHNYSQLSESEKKIYDNA